MRSNSYIGLLASLIISSARGFTSCMLSQSNQAIGRMPFVVTSNSRCYSRSRSVMFGRGRGGSKGGDKDSGAKKKRVKKENLPEKICVVCERPFTWRKKWERDWDNITCCSKACNAKRRAGPK
mmetsp:Transcript_18005/g.26784  ORF Transcript_18005/g.26784 Transcript_18005/m.26784 type:complete len:123 (-) Transcript_18005:336-704(-)